MRLTRLVSRVYGILYLALALLAAQAFADPAVPHQWRLVTNPSVSLNRVERMDVRSLYIMRVARWSNGERVILTTLNTSSSEFKSFAHYLGLRTSQLKRRWNHKSFTGIGSQPAQFNDFASMLDYIATTPGAVGYLPLSVDIENTDGVLVYDIAEEKP